MFAMTKPGLEFNSAYPHTMLSTKTRLHQDYWASCPSEATACETFVPPGSPWCPQSLVGQSWLSNQVLKPPQWLSKTNKQTTLFSYLLKLEAQEGIGGVGVSLYFYFSYLWCCGRARAWACWSRDLPVVHTTAQG